jgi:hypothetical protein
MMLQIMLMVSLESLQGGQVHCLGSMLFGLPSAKDFEY